MAIQRRQFIQLSAITAATGLMATLPGCDKTPSTGKQEDGLANMVAGVAFITKVERMQRLEKAQRLMNDNGLKAVVLDCGTSMLYFTGVSWWPSERTMVALLPAQGAIRYVCPAFEESRLREMLGSEDQVYVWQEDENPFERVATAMKDAGILSGTIGIEGNLRYFILDGLRRAAPNLGLAPALPVVMGCRMIKTSAEIALMQKATDVTMVAIGRAISKLEEGITSEEIANVVVHAHEQLGATNDFALISFGKASALPHGSKEPQTLRRGDIVLLDCGCVVGGYSSDVTRTVVFGAAPTPRQSSVWELEKKAQAAGFEAASLDAPCEAVDAAARKVIVDAGFGPGYKVPGLPHRTGHGIGMDGHEWSYMVKGNTQPLLPGMCFSIEPTIAIPGEFGIRLEDCVHMSEEGPVWFSRPSPAIGQPFV